MVPVILKLCVTEINPDRNQPCYSRDLKGGCASLDLPLRGLVLNFTVLEDRPNRVPRHDGTSESFNSQPCEDNKTFC